MLDYCSSHRVEASLVRLEDYTNESKSISLEVSRFHLIDLAHSTFEDFRDKFTRVSIDEDYPLANQVSLCSKLNFYGFEHFNGLNDSWE